MLAFGWYLRILILILMLLATETGDEPGLFSKSESGRIQDLDGAEGVRGVFEENIRFLSLFLS